MSKLKMSILLVVLLCPVANRISDDSKYSSIDSLKYETPLDQTSALKSLSIEGVDLPFRDDVLEYTLEVPYFITEAKIHYEPNYEGSIVEVIGGKQLYLGNNSIAIIVTSGYDGSTREYDITLIRKNDIVEVDNKPSNIENMLKASNTSNLSVTLTGEAITLPSSTSRALKESLKTLVYNWNDSKGVFVASLTLDGSKVINENPIDPNIKKEITDSKLIEYVEGYEYTPLSTVGSNLPKGTVYKFAVDGNEDTYHLYYYDGNTLNKNLLRNVNGTVEFVVEDGRDYVILGSSVSIEESKSLIGTAWILPSVIVTVLVILVFIITKFILVKVLRVPSIPTEEELKVKKKK